MALRELPPVGEGSADLGLAVGDLAGGDGLLMARPGCTASGGRRSQRLVQEQRVNTTETHASDQDYLARYRDLN